MRHDAEKFGVQSAPAARIAIPQLEEIDWPFKLVLSRIWLNLGVLVIYLDKGARTNHRIKRVVIHPNESIEIFSKAEILNERDRNFTPSLYHAREEIGLFNPRSRVKPHGKTDATFPVVDFGRN